MSEKSVRLAYQIRRHALEMTNRGGTSHIGSIFSTADFVAVLYADVLNYHADDPKWDGRDRVLLSKGHAGAGIYAALAESGFFPVEELLTHCQNGSRLSGHVSSKGVPGVEASTGSLGQGMPMAMGMAMAAKLDGKQHRVFAIVGDGECDEGAIWEAALFAHQYKLDNFIVTVDYNKMQSLTTCEETLGLEPFTDKWASFGWHVIRVDGHNHDALKAAYDEAKAAMGKGKPIVVIADTIKGKGVSFMEGDILWHYRTARNEEYDAALKELEANKP